MVFVWKHRYEEEVPAGIHDDATDEEKEDVAMQLIEHISDIRRVSRHIIDELFIDYANKELGMKRLDGQPISCFAELARTARETAKDGEDGEKTIFKLKYKCFLTGWENENEPKVMKRLGFYYRPWTSTQAIGKGYVSMINSEQLKAKRSQLKIPIIRRQKTAERNDRGGVIRLTKDVIKFDPTKHVVVVVPDTDEEDKE